MATNFGRTAIRYKRYYNVISSFPQRLKSDRAKAYTMIILSLFALSFFGIFAINPTLTTIAELKKKVEDAQLIDKKLQTKITNLSLLQKAYPAIEEDLPVVYDALPKDSRAANLLGKIKALSNRFSLRILTSQVQQTKLTGEGTDEGEAQAFAIVLSGSGSYENINAFFREIYNLDRVMTIEEFTIIKPQGGLESQGLTFSLRGLSYILFE